MKRITYILMLMMLPLSMAAQQDSIGAGALMQQLQQQGYKVYSTMPATQKLPHITPLNSSNVRRMLEGTAYKLSVYNNSWFILPNTQLQTKLPALEASRGAQSDGNDYVPHVVAWSENQIYQLGRTGQKQQEGKLNLKGVVVNFKTGMVQAGVQVVCRDAHETALTGMNGEFEMMLPPGRHTLEIRGMDIKDTQRHFNLLASGEARIELEEDDHLLDEVVVVQGRVEAVKTTQMGMEKLRPALLKNIPLAMGEADVMKMLQTLPGVKSVGEASSGFNVRGGATDQNLILLNNGTVYNPSHLFGMFSAFNSDMISDAELYKSSIPAQYGGRISSVLNITPREADKQHFHGALSVGLLTSKANLEIPVIKDRVSLLLSGRATYSDWMLKMIPESSGYKNGKAGFYDLGGVLSINLSRMHKLNLYGYYSHDRFAFSEYDKYGYTNYNASAEWRALFSETFNGKTTVGIDHYDYYNQESEVQSMAAKLSFNINQLYFKQHFGWQIGEQHKLQAGLNAQLYKVDPGKYEAMEHSFIQDKELQRENAFEGALYLEDEWNITPKLAVNAGVRLSAFAALGERDYCLYSAETLPSEGTVTGTKTAKSGEVIKSYLHPEIRLSARYSIDDHSSVKFGFNTMHQYIHKISNSAVMSPTDTWKLTDANIKPQSGWQVAGGYFKETADGNWEMSAEVYYKRMNDYLTYRSGGQLTMNKFLERDLITTQGQAYGIELQLKKPKGKLNGWVSYAYSRTFLRQNDPRVAAPVNGGDWFAAEYDRPHEFKLVGNYKFTERYSFSCNIDYSTGRPVTVPAGKYYNSAQHRFQPFYTERNGHRVPDYFRVDASFNIEPSHHLTLLTHSSLSIGVYNLLGRKNVYNIYYKVENGEVKGYRMSIFGAPIPFLSYNIKF